MEGWNPPYCCGGLRGVSCAYRRHVYVAVLTERRNLAAGGIRPAAGHSSGVEARRNWAAGHRDTAVLGTRKTCWSCVALAEMLPRSGRDGRQLLGAEDAKIIAVADELGKMCAWSGEGWNPSSSVCSWKRAADAGVRFEVFLLLRTQRGWFSPKLTLPKRRRCGYGPYSMSAREKTQRAGDRTITGGRRIQGV